MAGFRVLYRTASALRAIASPSFVEAVRRNLPACATTGRLLSRRDLGGCMLDDLYVDVKKRVTDLLVSWSKHGIVALVLDGWENVNRSHVVHILCMSGGATIFLDSVGTGVESQTAEHQADLAQELMDAHGGADRSSAVATDCAESCAKMRPSLPDKCPGHVPLGDQARIANLMFGDVLKVPWASAVFENA
jgi:Protein of unknown function (DUF 659)